jgi:tetratricopeptide (TPR) repeat protein
MMRPNWDSSPLRDGVLLETSRANEAIVLWVLLGQDRGVEYWDRVVVRRWGEVRVRDAACWIPAMAVRTKRVIPHGPLSRIFARLRRRASDVSWIMPGGGTAERCEGKRTDLALAWTTDGRTLDERILQEFLGGDIRFRRLSEQIVLASGVDRAPTPATKGEESEDTETTARGFLDSARAVGDRRGQAAALADLGMIRAKAGQAETALGLLNEALALLHDSGDTGGEADALVDLGHILELLGRRQDSRAVLEKAFALTDRLEDNVARKAVLERLGEAIARSGDPAGAAVALARARDAARATGDRRHEARLLWLQAAAWAEAGRSDLALARAEESSTLLRSAAVPEADWYEAQLRRYRSAASIPAGTMDMDVAIGSADSRSQGVGGPGVLRMALSATRAMATFLGTGMRATASDLYRDRVAMCRTCAHHAGLRCRVCGCFTSVKARMAHERCPIGRWQD